MQSWVDARRTQFLGILIKRMKKVTDVDYFVTEELANDGQLGEEPVRRFQDNEKTPSQ